MFRYLKALWYLVTGRLEKARKSLMENSNVMSATYDASIKKTEGRFQTTKEAVAELVRIEQELVTKIKELGERIKRLNQVKTGAQLAMQKSINDGRAKNLTKEQIAGSADFVKHQAAFNDASSTLAEVTGQYDEKDAELKTRQQQIAVYKTQLQKMQRAGETLRTEKQEALADVAIAKQSEAIDSMLAGITNDTIDTDLKDAREARQRAKARSTVTSELIGNDAKLAEDQYTQFALQSNVASQLDGLLDWGDKVEEPKESLEPAKLPEA